MKTFRHERLSRSDLQSSFGVGAHENLAFRRLGLWPGCGRKIICFRLAAKGLLMGQNVNSRDRMNFHTFR
jgi:hypothetical protein